MALGIFQPDKVPAIPADERAEVSTAQLIRRVIMVVLPPLGLIFLVLGSIIAGVAAPTEAASMGALGALLLAFVTGRLSMPVLGEVVRSSLSTSALVFFILICAQPFALAFRGLGGERLVHEAFAIVPGGLDGQIMLLMLILFCSRFFSRMDRDFLYCATDVHTDLCRRRCGDVMDCHPCGHEPADVVFDASIRMGVVFPQRRYATGNQDTKDRPNNN